MSCLDFLVLCQFLPISNGMFSTTPTEATPFPVTIGSSSSPQIIRKQTTSLEADWQLFREMASLNEIFSDNLSTDGLTEIFATYIIPACLAIPVLRNCMTKSQGLVCKSMQGIKKKQSI